MKDFMKDLAKSPLAILGLFWICAAVLVALTIKFTLQMIIALGVLSVCAAVALVSYMVYELARLALH